MPNSSGEEPSALANACKTAPGRTGFVQIDVVDGAVGDLKAFHVLPADVDDEFDVRQKPLGRNEVCDGFHTAVRQQECIADQILAVTGRGTAGELEVGICIIQLNQTIPDQLNRAAVV